MYFSRVLERLGGSALSKDQEPDIGAAFIKFAVVTKELSALMKTLVRNFITSHELMFIYSIEFISYIHYVDFRQYEILIILLIA